MKKFVQMQEFKKLNVGFALDEGYANPSEKFSLFYGERNAWCEYNFPIYLEHKDLRVFFPYLLGIEVHPEMNKKNCEHVSFRFNLNSARFQMTFERTQGENVIL